jgi:hypothetical protein
LSPPLLFWWFLEWPENIVHRTICYLKKLHKSLISINLLEYGAFIIGLVGSILAWEALLETVCPQHPVVLLWTDNTSATSWTK